jgi:hypothetical protein
MVVNNLKNSDRCYPTLIKVTVSRSWHGINGRFEDESRRAPEIKSKLAGPVSREAMKPPRRAT